MAVLAMILGILSIPASLAMGVPGMILGAFAMLIYRTHRLRFPGKIEDHPEFKTLKTARITGRIGLYGGAFVLAICLFVYYGIIKNLHFGHNG